MKTMFACLLVVGLGVVGVAYYASHRPTKAPPAPTAAKVEQPVCAAKNPMRPLDITATGTVKPEELVEVGAQVNGMIEAFGPDPGDPSRPIDHGSIVHKGDVLAIIDPTVYQAQVDYAEASLARAKADLSQLRAKCDQAKNEWLRAQSLLPEKAIADTDYDMIASNYHVAKANVEVGEAAIQQCRAQLHIAKTYLGYTVIKSPIDGVVIDRRVNVGQTVIAAFNAPGLFVIAKDLRRVQVWASVKETDIGYIRPGMPVQFNVDAYPGETFAGQVTEILLNPTKAQNCTTYTVVVATSNSHGMLPYLTAKLHFQIDRRHPAEPTCDIALQRRPRSAPPAVCATAAERFARSGRRQEASSRSGPRDVAESAQPGKETGAESGGAGVTQPVAGTRSRHTPCAVCNVAGTLRVPWRADGTRSVPATFPLL